MIEARLLINNVFSATHFIYTSDLKFLCDEGIDGEKRRIPVWEFYNCYENSFWHIDNIVK